MNAALGHPLDLNFNLTHQVSPASVIGQQLEEIQETQQSDNSPLEATVRTKLEIGPVIHVEEYNQDAPSTTQEGQGLLKELLELDCLFAKVDETVLKLLPAPGYANDLKHIKDDFYGLIEKSRQGDKEIQPKLKRVQQVAMVAATMISDHQSIKQIRGTLPNHKSYSPKSQSPGDVHEASTKKRDIKVRRKSGKDIFYNEAGIVRSEEDLVEAIESFEKTRAGHPQKLMSGFSCQDCERQGLEMPDFKNKYEQKAHLQSAHSKWPCQSCDQVFTNEKYRANHKKVDGCQGLAYCEICLQRFPSRKDERAHRQDPLYKKCQSRCETGACNPLNELEWQHRVPEEANIQRSERFGFQIKLAVELKTKDFKDDEFQLSCRKAGIIKNEYTKIELLKASLRQNKIKSIMLIQDKSVILAIFYEIMTTQYSRLARIIIDLANQPNLKHIGILIEALGQKLSLQRVTQIFVEAPKELKGFFEVTQFFTAQHPPGQDLKGFHASQNPHSIFMSRYLPNSVANLIPRASIPLAELTSSKALAVDEILKHWRRLGLQSVFFHHIKSSLKHSSIIDNKAARISDQAETPDEIFQIIYNRLRLSKKQFWDPCIFQQQWNHKTHFNALTEPWHGDFVFCNPPYSVGSKFISKALIEFIEGKNIVLLIPQKSAEGMFGIKFLDKVSSKQDLGQVRFKNFADKLMTPVSLVYLLQPVTIQYLEGRNRAIASNTADQDLAKPDSMKLKGSTIRERVEIAKRLRLLGSTAHQARMVSKLRFSDFEGTD